MKRICLKPLQGPVAAAVAIPGSKSYTNRALIMAALTKGPVIVRNMLVSDDTIAMLDCLRTLGIRCDEAQGQVAVVGDISDVTDGNYDLDVNLSGTTIRFLLPLACIVPGTKTLFGRESLNRRPIADLVDGVRQAGAQVDYRGFPPLRVTSSVFTSKTISMNGDVSSQYFSALLMVAPAVNGLTIAVVGEQISKPYIDMTIGTMEEFGVAVRNEDYQRYLVAPGQRYSKSEYVVEGDVSSASYFAAIAALTGSAITLTNMNPESRQADMGFFRILEAMGHVVEKGSGTLTIRGTGLIKPVSVDMEGCPDQAQTLAVLAAFADGVTHISGVRSLRVKETERVVAVERELAKMGIRTESTNDTLTIHGGNPAPAAIDTYHDHRMAMSFAVAGTKLAGMVINEPDVVGKTFPTFWEKLQSLGMELERQG